MSPSGDHGDTASRLYDSPLWGHVILSARSSAPRCHGYVKAYGEDNDEMARPSTVIVLVNGPPASGKTTLARPLARILGLPLVSKDPIKEAMADVLGPRGDVAWSSQLGAAAFEVMWAVSRDTGDCVLEGNFGAGSIERIRDLSSRPLEIFCTCPIDEILRRYGDRGPSRHPIHMGEVHVERLRRRFRTAPPSPLSLGPVLEVDTTTPTDLRAVEAWVHAHAGLG